MEQRIVDDEEALALAVADAMQEAITADIASRGRSVIGFSGGATPAPMLRELSRRDLAWDQVTVFQVDERVAPDGDPARNATMLARELLDHVSTTAYLMPVTAPDLSAAAEAYDQLLADVCGGVLDVVHLGLGPDGHTASLVPYDPVLDVTDADVAVTAEYQGRRRMTLTYPALNRARRIVWEIAGADKAEAVLAMVSGGDVPGARVSPHAATLIVDGAAGRLLPAR